VGYSHLFHFTASMPLPPPRGAAATCVELIYPCDVRELAPPMLEGGMEAFLPIQSYVAQGHWLGVALRENRVVHHSLVQPTGMAALEGVRRAFALRPGQVYIHYCWTAAGYRGQGLYSTMLRRILEQCRADPTFEEALIACRQDNLPSIKGILRAGFVYARSGVAVSVLRGHLAYRRFYTAPEMWLRSCAGCRVPGAALEEAGRLANVPHGTRHPARRAQSDKGLEHASSDDQP
jgi:GNAT superfamily N-acetyltransferase